MLTVGLCSIIKKIIFELGLKEPVRFGHSDTLAGSILSPTNKRPDEGRIIRQAMLLDLPCICESPGENFF